jgi:hypothetical protein
LNEIRGNRYREELERLKETDRKTLTQMFQELQAKKGASV